MKDVSPSNIGSLTWVRDDVLFKFAMFDADDIRYYICYLDTFSAEFTYVDSL